MRKTKRSTHMTSITIASDAAAIPQQIEPQSTASPAVRAYAPSAQEWSFERLSGCPVCDSVEASTVLAKKVRGFSLEFARCGNLLLGLPESETDAGVVGKLFLFELVLAGSRGRQVRRASGLLGLFQLGPQLRKDGAVAARAPRQVQATAGRLAGDRNCDR